MANNHYALIMAGGQGTRFWPWSTEARPKQFLPVIGDEPLITQTYERLRRVVPAENIFVVADRRYLAAVKEAIPGFSEDNFIGEPSPRNTAPCLIMANLVLAARDREATLLVSPADHYIAAEEIFADQLRAALLMAQNRCLVTAGIVPSEPHTGYGYIQFDPRKSDQINETDFFPVVAFREKPDQQTAERYIKEKRYLWNSGMFVYKTEFFREFLSVYAPDYYEKYLQLEGVAPGSAEFHTIFNSMRADSIDYVLLEKMKEIRMMKARFDWNDVGSWSSVYDAGRKDGQGNVTKGKAVMIDSLDSMAYSTLPTPIAMIGVRNVVVISTENGILVANRNELQRVKEAIAIIKHK